MSHRRPVIAALDPHRDDWSAAALGLLLARLAGAPLLLASVYTVPHVDDAEARRDEALAGIEQVRRHLIDEAGPAVQMSSTVLADQSSPARALHTLAERRNAVMIVVGSSPRGPIGRMHPGAVTDRLIHGAPCPVAVATSGFSADAIALIGIGFVDRPDGYAALAHGRELAVAAGALVRIITAREPTNWRFSGRLEASQLAALEQARDEAAQRAMTAGLAAIPASCSAGGEVVLGEPKEVLAAASAELDLLVCGSRGHGPVQTLLLGGVSHALVREAACPVLVVPLAEPVTAAGNADLRLARASS
jgi:nucleotide-binding universal stress UspA family protein